MKSMVLEKFSRPLSLRELPVPTPSQVEVLVQVHTCGLCGTDLKISHGLYQGVPLPHVLGHEIAGTVVQLGEGVSDLPLGQRVACYFYLYCGSCVNCRAGRESICLNIKGRLGFTRDGGFSQFIVLPAANCIPIPDNVEFAEAGVAVDAISTSYHALVTRGGIRAGEWVVVMGVGGVGLHLVQIACAFGANVIAVDVEPERLRFAEKIGAQAAVLFDPLRYESDVRAICGPSGVDVVVETVSRSETIMGNVAVLRPGGRLILVGYTPGKDLSIDQHVLIQKELSVLPSRASSRHEVRNTLDMISQGEIKPVISARYRLEELNDAMAAVESGQVLGRVVIDIPHELCP